MKIIKYDNPLDEENPFIVPGFSAVSNDEEDGVKKEYDSRLFVPISHKMAKKSLTYKAFRQSSTSSAMAKTRKSMNSCAKF